MAGRCQAQVFRSGLRFHDLRYTWASWHRQAGTSCDELKDLGGWKSRVMVDRYAKFGTEHLFAAASRIELGAKENAAIYVTISPRCLSPVCMRNMPNAFEESRNDRPLRWLFRAAITKVT